MPEWRWAWSAEIEKFPCAVLKQRHSHSVNLGNVAADGFAEKAGRIAVPDVLVFGSPCQSYSIAGKRLGLDDPRGNLVLVALGIIARLKPRWFVFENVPGLLSSSEGRDFGLFLRAVDELGYFGAWAGLDAQYRGLAQRRNRLFFVGNSRDWRYSAAALFEPESLCGDTAPRRQAGQRPGPTLSARTSAGGGLGTDFDCDGGLIAGSLGTRSAAHPSGMRHEADFMVVDRTLSHCLNGGGMGRQDWETETLISHTLSAARGRASAHDSTLETYVTHALGGGFDASEDGTGRGTPLIAIPILEAGARTGKSTDDIRAGCGIGESGDPMFTLQSGKQHAIGFSSKDHGADASHELSPTLRAGAHDGSHAGVPPAICFQSKASHTNSMNPGEISPTLNVGKSDGVAVAFQTRIARNGRGQPSEIVPALNGADAGTTSDMRPVVATSSMVRRLTPRECERLQGFPDDYTFITYRGKPAADGPRYKALCNSMAVPVMRWILSRIAALGAGTGLVNEGERVPARVHRD